MVELFWSHQVVLKNTDESHDYSRLFSYLRVAPTKRRNESFLSGRYRRSSSRILSLTCRRILNREKKALRLLMAFVITFYLCITPYYVTYFLLAVDPDLPPKWLLTFSYWSGYFNSTVNPILYNIFNDDFRKAFKPAFTGRDNLRKDPINYEDLKKRLKLKVF